MPIFADSGFHQCPLCTIAQISAMPVLRLAGPGELRVNGQPSGWEGTFEFTATSFQSSLSPSGTLTINGSLSVSALVNLCNPPGQNCIPTGVSFPVLDNAQWRYLAHFARTPEAGVDGLYRFENLTITVVPEPATVVLFLTGLGSLDLVQRLCRHAGGNRKHQRPVQTGLYSEDKWGRRELRDILP